VGGNVIKWHILQCQSLSIWFLTFTITWTMSKFFSWFYENDYMYIWIFMIFLFFEKYYKYWIFGSQNICQSVPIKLIFIMIKYIRKIYTIHVASIYQPLLFPQFCTSYGLSFMIHSKAFGVYLFCLSAVLPKTLQTYLDVCNMFRSPKCHSKHTD
jgi:hypothetical protein